MATRRQIRDVFYSELESYATQTHTITYGDGSTDTITVASENVDLLGPNKVESRPAVIYDEDYVTRLYNGVGAGPHQIERDSNGDVTNEIWREYMTASFLIRIEADNEIEKEPIYEAIRSGFGKYQFSAWDERDLHADITDIRVVDATSTDFTDADNTIRVDDVTVEFDWHRDIDLTGDNIDAADIFIDADNDGTDDDSFTVN